MHGRCHSWNCREIGPISTGRETHPAAGVSSIVGRWRNDCARGFIRQEGCSQLHRCATWKVWFQASTRWCWAPGRPRGGHRGADERARRSAGAVAGGRPRLREPGGPSAGSARRHPQLPGGPRLGVLAPARRPAGELPAAAGEGRRRVVGGEHLHRSTGGFRRSTTSGRRGASGPWSWAQCLPAFKRLETHLDHRGEWHGDRGPVSLRRSRRWVRGTEGLLVADASLMPTAPTADTRLPTLMIGERFGERLRDGVL